MIKSIMNLLIFVIFVWGCFTATALCIYSLICKNKVRDLKLLGQCLTVGIWLLGSISIWLITCAW